MLPLATTGPQTNSRESPKPTCGSHLLHGLKQKPLWVNFPNNRFNRFNHSHDSQCSFQGPSVFSDPMSPTSASWLDISARQSLDKWWQNLPNHPAQKVKGKQQRISPNCQVLGRYKVIMWWYENQNHVVKSFFGHPSYSDSQKDAKELVIPPVASGCSKTKLAFSLRLLPLPEATALKGNTNVRTPHKPNFKNYPGLWHCEHLERNSLSLWLRNTKWSFLDAVSLWWTHQVLQSYFQITWLDFSPWNREREREREREIERETAMRNSFQPAMLDFFRAATGVSKAFSCPPHALPQLLSTKRFWKECWPEPRADPWWLRW